MERYLQSLQKHLKGFPPEKQAELMEEIRSHIESGENDPGMGGDAEQRQEKLKNELGSPEDLGGGLQSVYRPNRFIDYLLVAVPYALYPLLGMLYTRLLPQYPWVDVRLDILIHLPLVAIGLWRRSAALTLFWISAITPGLLYIVTEGFWQGYWYFGLQTILWAFLLAGLLFITGLMVWKNRHDFLTVAYALLPLAVLLMGVVLWIIHPVSYTAYSAVDRSLLIIFLEMQGRWILFYGIFVTMALFFLPSNRGLRLIGLTIWAAMLGFGRQYLMDYQTGNLAMLAHWVYYLYVLLPLSIVFLAGWLERINNQHLQVAR